MARHHRRSDPATEQLRIQLFERLVDWREAHLAGLSAAGVTGGIIGYTAAYSPSLLPRPWGFQGFIAALSAMFGYQSGLLVSWMTGLLADLLGVHVHLRHGKRIWLAGGLLVLALLLAGIPLASLSGQRRTARYCQVKGPGPSWAALSTGAATVILALFALQWRGTVATIDWFTNHLKSRFVWALLAPMPYRHRGDRRVRAARSTPTRTAPRPPIERRRPPNCQPSGRVRHAPSPPARPKRHYRDRRPSRRWQDRVRTTRR